MWVAHTLRVILYTSFRVLRFVNVSTVHAYCGIQVSWSFFVTGGESLGTSEETSALGVDRRYKNLWRQACVLFTFSVPPVNECMNWYHEGRRVSFVD